MGTLWLTNDTLKQERLNRTSIAARYLFPIGDADDASAETLIPVVARVALGNSIGNVWAVPSGIAVALGAVIIITNTDSAARTASLYLIEPGETAASVARSIFVDTLNAGESVRIRVPYHLAASATIRGLASVANVVSVTVGALTFADQPAGHTLVISEGVALGSSLSTLYTCPGTPVIGAILLAVTLCNTDTVSRTPLVHVIPSGGSAGVANRIWNEPLVAKESVWIEDGLPMLPGAFLQASASSGSVVAARLTVLQISEVP